MIVYSVARRWFTEKAVAETYRKNLGLKPFANIKVEVSSRDDLAALLNALCEPPMKGTVPPAPATMLMVEAAYVDPHLSVPDCVPKFLVREAEEREALHKRVLAQKGKLP